ncbi:hypothetical protein [Oryza sativa Japonica Group]|uniref:Uncharacterized protein n=1 Tax=Oryza sativa subsp. japonica TaxID=39947 RepID=Q5ZDS7_ORYSJ|nr:hypothetical protein [Oryza sativa Japonica Group]
MARGNVTTGGDGAGSGGAREGGAAKGTDRPGRAGQRQPAGRAHGAAATHRPEDHQRRAAATRGGDACTEAAAHGARRERRRKPGCSPRGDAGERRPTEGGEMAAAREKCSGRLEAVNGGGFGLHGGNGAAGVEGEDGVDAGVRCDVAKPLEAKARPGEAALAGGERMEAANGEGGSGWRWKRRCGGGLGKRSGGRGVHDDCGAGEGDGAVRGGRERRRGAAGVRQRAAARGLGAGRAREGAAAWGKWGKRMRGGRGLFL